MRHVELRNIAPRTRVSYLAWVRRLHESIPGRDITTLTEGEVLDFLIALRHKQGLKDSTINQALCALRGFYRDHLGCDWKAWNKIKIRRVEQLPNVLSRDEVAKFLGAQLPSNSKAETTTRLPLCAKRLSTATSTTSAWSLHLWRKDHGLRRHLCSWIEPILVTQHADPES